MEENVDVFALVLDQLNRGDLWFTTKSDPTVQEPSSYYKLDEYGDPTDNTIKKITKEVNSLIGDGAVDEFDAVDLWINDALVDCKIDYRDNLVTRFEDKPVVDNIEAYENPVQFPQSKKQESRKLQEHTETILKSVDVNSHWVKPFVDLFKSEHSDAPIDKIYLEVVEGGWQPCTAFIVSGYNTYRVYVASLNDGIYMSDKDDVRIVKGDFKRDYDYVEESKKCENKVKKTEGAGAGYEISGSISNAHVNSFNVDNVERTKYNERVVTLTCDVDVDLDDLYFASYEYGGKIDFPVKAKVTSFRMIDNDTYDDGEDEPEVDDYNVRDALNGTSFKTVIGGGWIHQTFDGKFESDADGNTTQSYFYTDLVAIKIVSNTVVEFIDGKVTGDVDESTYEVFDMNSDILDSFDDEDAAIEFAKKNNGVQVVRVMHNFSLTDEEGSVDDDPDYETVWERDYDKQYKFDDVEESKSLKKQSYEVWQRYFEDGKVTTEYVQSFDSYEKAQKFADGLNEDPDCQAWVKDLKENKKIEAYGKHDYVSKYDELDDLLNVYAGIDNGKKELYNAFNNDTMVEFDDDEYDEWLEDMKNEHFDELMAYLQEKDEDTKYYMDKVNEDKNVNFKLRTKDKKNEDYQKRLDEVNNKSKGLIDDMVSKDDFDETSAYGRIVMRTAHMFDVLSKNGYDVDVTFDNGESTSAIQLGPQGGKIMITITDAEKPLRAFTSGNLELIDDNLKTLEDVQNIIDTL